MTEAKFHDLILANIVQICIFDKKVSLIAMWNFIPLQKIGSIILVNKAQLQEFPTFYFIAFYLVIFSHIIVAKC